MAILYTTAASFTFLLCDRESNEEFISQISPRDQGIVKSFPPGDMLPHETLVIAFCIPSNERSNYFPFIALIPFYFALVFIRLLTRSILPYFFVK